MPDKKNHHHHKQPAQAHCWTKADEDEDKIEELGTNEKPVFKVKQHNFT